MDVALVLSIFPACGTLSLLYQAPSYMGSSPSLKVNMLCLLANLSRESGVCFAFTMVTSGTPHLLQGALFSAEVYF